MPNEFDLDRWMLEYHEPGGRSVGLRPIRDATRAVAMFSFPAAHLVVDHRDVAARKRLLREQVADLGRRTPEILTHLDDTPDFYLDQVAQVVLDRWSSGRVGLIGDAANWPTARSTASNYPTTPGYRISARVGSKDWGG